MANSIALAAKYMPILDALYKRASITQRLDAITQPMEFAGANVVKVFKTSVVGMGTYSRATGYPVGDVTATWETLTLAASRGRELNIDRMDNEETLDQAFGTLAGEFMRTQVTPEVDAYRFAKYASWSGVSAATPATLSASTVLAAIDAAILQMDEDEVPQDGRLLFVSSTIDSYIRAAPTRFRGNDSTIDNRVQMYNNVAIIPVPQSRFYTAIDLDAGSSASAGGYAKSAGGKDLNFMLIHPSAVVQATKLAQLKIFSPDENQDGDNWKIQYRLYHDAFVLDNKVDGVYIHNKA